jgi:acetyl esterase/lipase
MLYAMRLFTTMFFAMAASMMALPAAAESYAVTLDPAVHGRYQIHPPLPADGKVPAGTVVTVTSQPDAGFSFDSGYHTGPGPWGEMFFESMTPTFQVTVSRAMRIGVSFIETAAVEHVVVQQDIVYAKPGVKPLKYDVYTPRGAKQPLPIVIIIHGGGWIANDENIMRGLARELTRGGQFVAVSIDYRWAGKADGDVAGNTMANLVEDVFGAIAHTMEHATTYGGDSSRIVLTGDSAGGHLAAVASLMVDRIGDAGFGRKPGVFEFRPSYLPRGRSLADVRQDMRLAIKAAAPSYGVFSGPFLKHYADDHEPAADKSWVEAITPLLHIPPASDRAVPQFLLRGTLDPVITDEMCRTFVEALVKAGQRAEYVQVGGASHAFLDWVPDAARQAIFRQFGTYHAAQMRAFFLSLLRP